MHSSDEIVRAPLHIDVNPADVFTQHADANQLNSPKEQNRHDQLARQIDTENCAARSVRALTKSAHRSFSGFTVNEKMPSRA